MLSILRGQSGVTLSLDLPVRVLYLYPAGLGPDPQLHGVVKISVPTRRSVKSLVVTLEGTTLLHGAPGARGGWLAEKISTIHLQETFPIGDATLEAGEHSFAFTFVVPSATTVTNAPVRWAGTSHFVHARLKSDSAFVSAVEKRVGLYLVALPGEPGTIPDPFQKVFEVVSPELGPLRIDLASPHLTQGALLHSRILIADPPSPSTIKSIRLYIAPTYRAKYLEEARPPLQPAEQVNLGRVERGRGEPLLSNKVEIGENIDLGASWRRDATFRMPTGDELWPSTLPGSDTRMNVQHNLVIELVFTPKGRKATKLTLDTPVTIFSCITVLADSMQLPVYAPNSSSVAVRKPIHGDEGFVCVCEYGLAELLAQGKDVGIAAATATMADPPPPAKQGG